MRQRLENTKYPRIDAEQTRATNTGTPVFRADQRLKGSFTWNLERSNR